MPVSLRSGLPGVDTQHVVGDDFGAVLAAAQNGREEYFAILWRDVNPVLLRYLRVLAPDAAEDIAAETWVQVVRGLPRFTGDEAAWRAWLFTTARRRMLDHARLSRRHPTEPLEAMGATDTPSSPDTEQLVLEHIATESALALLSRLPAQQAEVIMLRVLAGLDTEAVADILGKSPGAVRVCAHRGLKKLEELLSRRGATPRAGVTL